MGCPVAMFGIHLQSGARVRSFAERLHGDTSFNGTDADTQVTANAFFVFDNELALAVDGMGDCLMGGIFTGNVAPAAFDA